MSKTNCINCGAAKDIDEIKCPFCGTTYIDLTAIDFDSHAPVVCDFVMPHTREVLQFVAIPSLESATIKQETADLSWWGGNMFFNTGYSAEFCVSFVPVPRNGVLFRRLKGAAV